MSRASDIVAELEGNPASEQAGELANQLVSAISRGGDVEDLRPLLQSTNAVLSDIGVWVASELGSGVAPNPRRGRPKARQRDEVDALPRHRLHHGLRRLAARRGGRRRLGAARRQRSGGAVEGDGILGPGVDSHPGEGRPTLVGHEPRLAAAGRPALAPRRRRSRRRPDRLHASQPRGAAAQIRRRRRRASLARQP